jgi:AcrR family transcriptional regulator
MASEKLDGRRERSRRTRGRIIEAARGLFLERGYITTAIDDVADRAGVAVQTVYYVFGTKPNLLAAVLDSTIGGDVEPVSVLERDWVDSLRAEQDATVAVTRLVDASVAILARTTPIYGVVREAAADADVAAMLHETRRRRRHDQLELIDILSRSGHLHPDVDRATAADVLYAVMNEEVFQLLTVDCGWDEEQVRTWMTNLMLQQLVHGPVIHKPPKASPPPRTTRAGRRPARTGGAPGAGARSSTGKSENH